MLTICTIPAKRAHVSATTDTRLSSFQLWQGSDSVPRDEKGYAYYVHQHTANTYADRAAPIVVSVNFAHEYLKDKKDGYGLTAAQACSAVDNMRRSDYAMLDDELERDPDYVPRTNRTPRRTSGPDPDDLFAPGLHFAVFWPIDEQVMWAVPVSEEVVSEEEEHASESEVESASEEQNGSESEEETSSDCLLYTSPSPRD